jgi:hypothetical protein
MLPGLPDASLTPCRAVGVDDRCNIAAFIPEGQQAPPEAEYAQQHDSGGTVGPLGCSWVGGVWGGTWHRPVLFCLLSLWAPLSAWMRCGSKLKAAAALNVDGAGLLG